MKNSPRRRGWCISKSPSGFCKKTDSRFRRWAEQCLGGRGVSWEVFRGSKHRTWERTALKALPWVYVTRPGASPDPRHHLSLTPLPPALVRGARSFWVFSEETPPPPGPCVAQGATGGHPHHSLSKGNRWEAAAAFSLLVFLGHFGFCSSSASRFWGQEAARILDASA